MLISLTNSKIIIKVTNKMQLYWLIYYSWSAVHVLGDIFANHQEHLTVFTVFGSTHPSCCWLVSWMSFNSSMMPASSNWGEYYQIL